MTRMKTILTLSALALPLMGATCNEKLQSALPAACNAEAVFYTHYRAVADNSDAIPAGYKSKVELAQAQIDRVCADPSNATTISVADAASKSYAAIKDALAFDKAAAAKAYPELRGLRRAIEQATKQ